MLFYCFFVCRFSLSLFRRCHKLKFAPLKLLKNLSPSQAPHKLLFNDLPPSDSVERSWTSWLLKSLTRKSLSSLSADEELNDFWAKDLCSQGLFLEGTFGPEVTSASTRRGLITVLDQAEDLAENIPNPCKMFKIFQQNRRVASRWNATCEELEMVTGFEKVVAVTSATGCNSSFLLMWTIALELTYPGGKQPRPQGTFPSGRGWVESQPVL